jgi:hypothetical protein
MLRGGFTRFDGESNGRGARWGKNVSQQEDPASSPSLALLRFEDSNGSSPVNAEKMWETIDTQSSAESDWGPPDWRQSEERNGDKSERLEGNVTFKQQTNNKEIISVAPQKGKRIKRRDALSAAGSRDQSIDSFSVDESKSAGHPSDQNFRRAQPTDRENLPKGSEVTRTDNGRLEKETCDSIWSPFDVDVVEKTTNFNNKPPGRNLNGKPQNYFESSMPETLKSYPNAYRDATELEAQTLSTAPASSGEWNSTIASSASEVSWSFADIQVQSSQEAPGGGWMDLSVASSVESREQPPRKPWEEYASHPELVAQTLRTGPGDTVASALTLDRTIDKEWRPFDQPSALETSSYYAPDAPTSNHDWPIYGTSTIKPKETNKDSRKHELSSSPGSQPIIVNSSIQSNQEWTPLDIQPRNNSFTSRKTIGRSDPIGTFTTNLPQYEEKLRSKSSSHRDDGGETEGADGWEHDSESSFPDRAPAIEYFKVNKAMESRDEKNQSRVFLSLTSSAPNTAERKRQPVSDRAQSTTVQEELSSSHRDDGGETEGANGWERDSESSFPNRAPSIECFRANKATENRYEKNQSRVFLSLTLPAPNTCNSNTPPTNQEEDKSIPDTKTYVSSERESEALREFSMTAAPMLPIEKEEQEQIPLKVIGFPSGDSQTVPVETIEKATKTRNTLDQHAKEDNARSNLTREPLGAWLSSKRGAEEDDSGSEEARSDIALDHQQSKVAAADKKEERDDDEETRADPFAGLDLTPTVTPKGDTKVRLRETRNEGKILLGATQPEDPAGRLSADPKEKEGNTRGPPLESKIKERPLGATANEIKLLNDFLKIAGPEFNGNALSTEEWERLHDAALSAGIPDAFLNQMLDQSVGIRVGMGTWEDSSASSATTSRHSHHHAHQADQNTPAASTTTVYTGASRITGNTRESIYSDAPPQNSLTSAKGYVCGLTTFWTDVSDKMGMGVMPIFKASRSGEAESVHYDDASWDMDVTNNLP